MQGPRAVFIALLAGFVPCYANGIDESVWGVSTTPLSSSERCSVLDGDQPRVSSSRIKARIEADDWLNNMVFGSPRYEYIEGDDEEDLSEDLLRGPSPYSQLRLHLNTICPEKPSTRFDDANHGPFSMHETSLLHTGTTIAGCCCRVEGYTGPSAVVLAADSRATSSTTVADTDCEKIHRLAPTIYACGAGTSGDLDHLTRQCHYAHALESMRRGSIGNGDTKGRRGGSVTITSGLSLPSHVHSIQEQIPSEALFRSPSVESTCRWLQHQLYESRGNIGANLIVGGVDKNGGASLSSIHPHGSRDADLPFAALGSGGMAALGVLEQGFSLLSESLPTIEEGIEMVSQAIVAGIRNDLGSGSHVDLCVVYPDGTSEYRRSIVPEEYIEKDVGNVTNKLSSYVGVSGFGNAPIVVGPRVLRLDPTIESEKRKERQWDDVLGL